MSKVLWFGIYSPFRRSLKNLEEEEEFCAGIYEVKPLIETRFSFQLNKWEMDNLSRRAKDIDLSP